MTRVGFEIDWAAQWRIQGEEMDRWQAEAQKVKVKWDALSTTQREALLLKVGFTAKYYSWRELPARFRVRLSKEMEVKRWQYTI